MTGVVKEWRWTNPHTWLYFEADDEKAGKVEWRAEGRAPGILLRAGWSKTSLQPGETVRLLCARQRREFHGHHDAREEGRRHGCRRPAQSVRVIIIARDFSRR